MKRRPENPWTGLLAGLAGGLAASWVMNRFQKLWTKLQDGDQAASRHEHQGGQVQKGEAQRRPEREQGESATQKAAAEIYRRVLGRAPDPEQKELSGRILHYGFGAATGAAYGVAAEVEPAIAAGAGVPFGVAVWALADEIAVPAAGFSKSAGEYPLSVHAQSFFSHLVYGATTEAVRRMIRKVV